MAFVQQNPRGNVLRCTTEGICTVLDDLCKPEVSELDVPIGIDQNVFWLEVTVHNVFAVTVFKDGSNL